MIVNFRYKAKEIDTMIRGLLFRTDSWLETEARIPLNEAEELSLEVEMRIGNEFQKLEKALINEAKAVGHMIPSLGRRLENLVKGEPDVEPEKPVESPKAEEPAASPVVEEPATPVTDPVATPVETTESTKEPQLDADKA
jgi:hypothetical protein